MIFGRNRKVRHEQVSLPEELLEERDHEVAALPEAAETGPHDVATRPDPAGMIDLGSLRLRAVQGMKLRLDVEDATKRIVAATVSLGRSALQVQAFSAPRRAGLWDEVREELRDSLDTTPNATVQEQAGRFGTEILTRVPAALPDGSPGWNVARFVGVDGPRWFVRGVFHGEAAFQPEAAAQLVRAIAEDSRLPQLRIERIDGHGIDTEPVAAITAALAEAGCYRSPRSLRLRAGDR